MATKKNRRMKVRRQSGYNYNPTPAIILKGNWLKEAGFEIGDFIAVRCEEGRLIIEPDAERDRMTEEEEEFIAREIKALRRRFEKERLHVQFVAEQGAMYSGSETKK